MMRTFYHLSGAIKQACILFLILFGISVSGNRVSAQTATPPSGAGTAENPYQIATLENLYWLTLQPNAWNKYFIQIADIDASSSSSWNGGSGLYPIGSGPAFTGSYNGQNHVISGLVINRNTDGQVYPKIGFFAGIGSGGIVSNLGLTNATINGYQYVGALAGWNAGTIHQCFSSGAVTGKWHWVGGLVGENQTGGVISSSFSTASVTGIGSGQMYSGFAGSNAGTLSNCYSTGNSTGTNYVSSFVGRNVSGSISMCFATGYVTTPGSNSGGLVAYNAGTVSDSFWNTETTGQSTSQGGGMGKTTVQMQTQSTYSGWNFSSVWTINAGSNNGYPYLISNPPPVPLLTWDGSLNSDWTNAVNWTPEIVPSSEYNVDISDVSNEPVIAVGVGATCNNLTVNSGASLTVAPGGSLITKGTVTGNITIQRSLTGSANLEANTYHLVSIPLATSSASTSSLFLGSYLFSYQPSSNSWLPMGPEITTVLDETTGYMIYYPNTSTTYTFTGQPNTGTFAPTVTYAGNSGGNNFALVPNPYPSNIDWNAASGWTKTNIGNSIWVYNNGNYAIWDGSNSTNDGSRFIAVGQAFFVQTTATTPELVMNNDVRTHTSAAFLKNNVVPANQLRVKAMANNMQDEIIAGFADGKSAAYDPLEDALKLFGAEDAPQLYTLAGDSKVSINQLAELNGSAAVPMYFETEFNGEVNFEFSQLESFPADLKIRLEDKITGQWVNLRETSQYIFTHSPANTADRFVLHFGSAAGFGEKENCNIGSWFSGNTFYLSTPEYAGEKAKVEIFSISGQLIFSREFTLSNLQQFNLNAKGSVVTRITFDNKVLNTKAIVL